MAFSRFWLLSCCSVLLVSACALPVPPPATVPASGAALMGGEWVATQVTGVETLKEPLPQLRWSSAEYIVGSGGCNAFAGKGVVNQGAFQLGRMEAPGRKCLGIRSGGQEDRFFKALEAARAVRLVDGQLLLQDEAGQVLIRFAKR